MIDYRELKEWVRWHEAGRQAVGLSATLDESLSEIIVKRKGPRMCKGELANPNEDQDRIMVKFRPTLRLARFGSPLSTSSKGLPRRQGDTSV